MLDLGRVGFTAKITVNGNACPIRISEPYSWDISGSVIKGENEIEIIAANTLVNRIPDDLSSFMPLAPSGVTGPVTLGR